MKGPLECRLNLMVFQASAEGNVNDIASSMVAGADVQYNNIGVKIFSFLHDSPYVVYV